MCCALPDFETAYDGDLSIWNQCFCLSKTDKFTVFLTVGLCFESTLAESYYMSVCTHLKACFPLNTMVYESLLLLLK